MLNKLLKYEFKASGRILLPIYAAVFIMGILSSLFIKIPSGALENMNILKLLSVIFMAIYITLIIFAVIFSVIIAVSRFKKNLFDSEGYLMNTLPVNPSANIAGKLIVAIVYEIAGMVVAALSAILSVIIYSGFPKIDFTDFWNFIGRVFQDYGGLAVSYGFELIILILLSVATVNLMIYAAVSIGHTANTHKVMKSVVAYIGLYIVTQIINLNILKIAMHIFNDSFSQLQGTPYIGQPYLIGIIILQALYCVGFFVITNYFLKNKLNLQ